MDEGERRAVATKIRRLIREGVAKFREADRLVASLGGVAAESKKFDENGEPTWSYAVAVALPKDIHLTKKFAAYAVEHGHTMSSALELFSDFKIYYGKSNAKKWSNWTLVWMQWVRRDAKSKNRVDKYEGRFDRAG